MSRLKNRQPASVFTNCGKAEPGRCKVEAKPEPKLTRVAFAVSRLMEFCSKRELQNQTGHSVYDWPLVWPRNCSTTRSTPARRPKSPRHHGRSSNRTGSSIQDNANGIDAATIESILDYTIRVSSREAYVSPTRGAQGNALKTILAMGYVLHGQSKAERRGWRDDHRDARRAHRIEFRADHINNQPKIIHTTKPSSISAGTRFTVQMAEAMGTLG